MTAPARNALSTIAVVARREIVVKLRDRAFIWTTVLMLVLVAVATVVPALLSQRTPSLRVAVQGPAAVDVVERAALLGAQAEDDGEPPTLPDALIDVGGLPPAAITWVAAEPDVDLGRLLRDGDVDAVLVGDDPAALRLVGLHEVAPELSSLITAAANELQVAQEAAADGLSPAQVSALTQPVPPVLDLVEPRREGTVAPELLILAFAFLFYVSVLTFGMSIAQSVAEEKQSRVVELLVAAMPVRWLLAGKVVGTTIMALAQVLVVVGAGAVGAVVVGQRAFLGQLLGASGWFVAFFLLGFVLLACLWAVGGSLAARVEDLSSTTALMQILVVAALFAAILPIDDSVRAVLSYVPFTAPLLMPARVVLGTADAWEPYVSAAGVALTAVVLVRLSSRLYARSVLHTSGRLRVVQVWRGVE